MITNIDEFREQGLAVARWAADNRQTYADALLQVGHVDNDLIVPWTDASGWVDDIIRNHGWSCIEAIAQAYDRRADATLDTVMVSPVVVDDTVTIPRAEFDRLTREATRTFSSYDERMRPMFLEAARTANDNDFCGEYDRIAESLGAPGRDELFSREYTFSVRVEVTRTVYVNVSATGSDESDAWDSIEDDEIRETLDSDDVEYDDIEYSGYSDVTEGDLIEN